MKERKRSEPLWGLSGMGFEFDAFKRLITIGKRTYRFNQGIERLREIGAEGTIFKIHALLDGLRHVTDSLDAAMDVAKSEGIA